MPFDRWKSASLLLSYFCPLVNSTICSTGNLDKEDHKEFACSTHIVLADKANVAFTSLWNIWYEHVGKSKTCRRAMKKRRLVSLWARDSYRGSGISKTPWRRTHIWGSAGGITPPKWWVELGITSDKEGALLGSFCISLGFVWGYSAALHLKVTRKSQKHLLQSPNNTSSLQIPRFGYTKRSRSIWLSFIKLYYPNPGSEITLSPWFLFGIFKNPPPLSC